MKFMKRALALAEKGRGRVSPNPLVGSVIVFNNKIIGEGFHEVYGGKHAEVNALESIDSKQLHLLKQSTLYCNLEPCSKNYPGKKNPPCCDVIITAGIQKVIVGQLDPNPMVAGSGIRKLEEAGIDVELGLLEEECINLNRGFNSVMRQNRPFIHLKWAQTLDGQIATKNGVSKWISSEECRAETHYYRSLCDGIMVGNSTIINDDPILDARYGFSPSPRPVILDRKSKLDRQYKVFKRDPIVITSESGFKLEESGYFNLFDVVKSLPDSGINSLFVEGGSNLLTQFLKEGLWDQITIYIAPKILGGGISPVADIGISHPQSALEFSRKYIKQIDDHIVFNGWK